MSYEYEYDPYEYEDNGHYSEEDYGYESDHTKSVCNKPDWEPDHYTEHEEYDNSVNCEDSGTGIEWEADRNGYQAHKYEVAEEVYRDEEGIYEHKLNMMRRHWNLGNLTMRRWVTTSTLISTPQQHPPSLSLPFPHPSPACAIHPVQINEVM